MKRISNIGKIVILFLIISACSVSPSEGDIQTAIARTEEAKPVIRLTISPISTITITPSNTATFLPSETVTPTQTPTITPDIRIYNDSTKNLLCKKEDLPGEINDYILPNGWLSPHTNEEIIQNQVDTEHARKYINETGRVEGWWIEFRLSKKSQLLPQYIFCQVIKYKTTQGASLGLDWKLWDYKYKYYPISLDKIIGQNTKAQYYDYIDNKGVNWRGIEINFLFQNLEGRIVTFSQIEYSNVDIALEIAEKLFIRLSSAPLVSME